MQLLFCVRACGRVYLAVQYENIFFVPVKKVQNRSSEFTGLLFKSLPWNFAGNSNMAAINFKHCVSLYFPWSILQICEKKYCAF
jgi:hypothetical protein